MVMADTVGERVDEETVVGSCLSRKLETDINDALAVLKDTLRCSSSNCESHVTVIVAGLTDDERVLEAIARYLVGIRASAIDAALNIKAELEDTQEDRSEILKSVIQIVKQEVALPRDPSPGWVIRERNPWIAEGIWHLLMALAASRPDIHPPGLILLLNYPHIKAKDHGLDVSAIFDGTNGMGFSIIETKAYKDDPNGAISDATDFFREVRKGTHDSRIRQVIQTMRKALPETEQHRISGSFWKRNRVYIYNQHCSQSDGAPRWTSRRPSLEALLSANERVFIMPNDLADFDQFFDDIANRMRRYAEELQQCTTTTPVAL